MILEKIKGINLENEFISEDDYEAYGIIDINDFISRHISKYGYKIKKIYDHSKNLIVIEPISLDYLKYFGFNHEVVYNYVTGEVISNPILPNLDEKIDTSLRKDRELYYVNGHLVFFTLCIDGVYYIYDVKNNKTYPILYTHSPRDEDEISIVAKDPNDGTTKMIKKIDLESYSFLINNYNFIYNGTSKRAINFDLVYGIKYDDGQTSYYYYQDEKSRDEMYDKIQGSVKNIISNGNVKVITKKNN